MPRAAALALEAAARAVGAPGLDGGDGVALRAARLSDVARLDTCVTVVDAANLLANMTSLQTMRVRGCGCGRGVEGG